MTELRDALLLFEHFAAQESHLGQKELLQALCTGFGAASRGWRLLAEGEGDEAKILEDLAAASILLQSNAKRPVGARKKLPEGADEIVLDRYFNRDPLSLPLRSFVEAAFDEGLLDRNIRVDSHVQRLERFLAS